MHVVVRAMHVDAALARWRALLGDEHVVDEPGQLARARATFPTENQPTAWLSPGTVDEVRACVAIAHELGIPLHPTSRGRNWGYGSRVPWRDGAAILDLARLDRIVDFDEKLAYVTVEPGVTFRQLARYLRDIRARVFASVTGGTAGGSVVANALERGDGSGPLGDRFGHVCGLEIVLPDGELVHTGFRRFGPALGPLARWGLGPDLDGLFAQSSLGIVTRATIWLAPYPASFQIVGFALDDDAQLPALVDAARELKLAGVAPATFPIWNDYKALSLVGTYPFAATHDATPLPDDVRISLRDAAGLGRWNGSVPIYGASRDHALAIRAIVEAKLAPIAPRLAFREGPADPLDAPEDLCGPHLGVPHDRSAAAVYWRKRAVPARLDPDGDRCGFLWLSHAIPFRGDDARAFATFVSAELYRDGFEPQLALLGVGARALSAVASIAWDRDIAGEDDRALACFHRVHALLVARGWPPFRDGIASPPLASEPAYDRLVDAIAGAIDPRGILRRR